MPRPKSGEAKYVFALNQSKLRALTLLLSGSTTRQAAEVVGVSDRAVRNWRTEWRHIFVEQNEGYLALTTRLTRKAFQVIEKYLDGKGGESGGDLRAAIRWLENMELMTKAQGAQVTIDASQNTTNNTLNVHNSEIPVQSEEDDNFAKQVPAELRRISGLLAPPSGEA